MSVDMNLIPWEVIVAVLLVITAINMLTLFSWALRRPHGSRFPLKRVIFLLLCVGIIAVPFQLVDDFAAKMRAGFSQSQWNTGDDPQFPELATPRYPKQPDEVYQAAFGLIRAKEWRIISSSDSDRKIFADIPVMIGGPDRLSLAVVAENGQTRLDLQTTSERTKTEFGVGRRAIVSFLKDLDQQLGVVRP
jgi:hypothetical protein